MLYSYGNCGAYETDWACSQAFAGTVGLTSAHRRRCCRAPAKYCYRGHSFLRTRPTFYCTRNPLFIMHEAVQHIVQPATAHPSIRPFWRVDERRRDWHTHTTVVLPEAPYVLYCCAPGTKVRSGWTLWTLTMSSTSKLKHLEMTATVVDVFIALGGYSGGRNGYNPCRSTHRGG